MVNPAGRGQVELFTANELPAGVSLLAAEGNVNASFYKPGQASPDFLVGYCLRWSVSTIRLPTRRECGNRRSFTTNYTSGLHSQSVQSSIGIARIGTFVAVVIETPEHKAVSENSEVISRLTANSCIALCSSKNAVSNSSAYNQILPVAAMRVSNPIIRPGKSMAAIQPNSNQLC